MTPIAEMPRRAARLRAACAACACALFPACTATVMPADGLSDARSRVVGLERRVAELESRNAELEAQLGAANDSLARAAGGAAGTPDREVAEATPRMVALAFAGGSAEWSGAAVDGGRAATVNVALEPRDALGRVLQVAGRAEVTVALVDPAGGVTELGHRAFSPSELRAAWRAGFMGTHYALEVPVRVPAGAQPGGAWSVSASLADGWTREVRRSAGSVAAPAP
jgi:hypothetical protein